MSEIIKHHGGEALAKAVEAAYTREQTDYYMEPMALVDENGTPVGKIKDGDTVVFCCRRGEREIELTDAFTDPSFDKFQRDHLKDLQFVIMTMYHEKYKDLPVAFAPERVNMPLAQVISEAGLRQFHCSESEKFAHVTFFFNGGFNQPFPGETDVCVPSPKGIPFDSKPELSLPEVAEKVMGAVDEGYEFIITNFANGDVIGHTSNSEAKLLAAEAVSAQVDKVAHYAKEKGYVVAITADHGNIETLRSSNGKPHVAHTSNLVPFVVLDPENRQLTLRDGSLGDVAPTVLSVLGIDKPAEMTGSSLVEGEGLKGSKMMLIILDGWGYGSMDDNDAIYSANTPEWDALLAKYPNSKLHASGGYVGLADGKPGNSEAGHTNLGAGRTVAQDDVRMDNSIKDGSFKKNPVLMAAVERARQGGALHLLALLTEKSSHGCIDYPLMINEMAEGVDEVYFHIIFDGRSTEPGSAPALLRALDAKLADIGRGVIVDGIGRGIALDRDGNFAKIEKAYREMTEGAGVQYKA